MFRSSVTSLLTFLTRLLLYILSAGPIPKHVAFVMDGNRRFARLRGRPVMDGHLKGFDSLKNVRVVQPKVYVYW